MKIISQAESKATIQAQDIPVRASSDNTLPDQGASAPVITIIPTSDLTWRESALSGMDKEIRMTGALKALCKSDRSFKNWLYTVISCHITNRSLQAVDYFVPDQFREYLGGTVTMEQFAKASLSGNIQSGPRPQPAVEGVNILI